MPTAVGWVHEGEVRLHPKAEFWVWFGVVFLNYIVSLVNCELLLSNGRAWEMLRTVSWGTGNSAVTWQLSVHSPWRCSHSSRSRAEGQQGSGRKPAKMSSGTGDDPQLPALIPPTHSSPAVTSSFTAPKSTDAQGPLVWPRLGGGKDRDRGLYPSSLSSCC